VRILIVEDEFGSRKLMQKFLSPYGVCDLAVDGEEAVEAFTLAMKEEEPYDLICLDIMMPKKDGQTVLKEIREIEERHNINGLDGVKIIMTTALNDPKNILEAFKSQCEAYIPKPISKQKLLEEMRALDLL
jgi:two-component system, chemotaxis family, chemotaxis protein CheY